MKGAVTLLLINIAGIALVLGSCSSESQGQNEARREANTAVYAMDARTNQCYARIAEHGEVSYAGVACTPEVMQQIRRQG